MTVIVATHILLWALAEPERLAEHRVRPKKLPFHHRDPFDRMLIAQSIETGFPIVTDDERFAAYGCSVL